MGQQSAISGVSMGCGAAVGQGDISGVREHQWGVCGVGGRQWGGGEPLWGQQWGGCGDVGQQSGWQ